MVAPHGRADKLRQVRPAPNRGFAKECYSRFAVKWAGGDGSMVDAKIGEFEDVWFVWVELGALDDARVREAVAQAVGLAYGAYDNVAFESGTGAQFYRPRPGAVTPSSAQVVQTPARTLTFSLPRDEATLRAAIGAIRAAHSYEEPVIYAFAGLAARARTGLDRENPNRWWNRGATP